jgi:hypothetical protein
MRNYPQIGIQIPDVLLPKPGISLNRWAVIACDQFTSQPEYWHRVADIVDVAPSTYHMILPEIMLGSSAGEERQRSAQHTMRSYLQEGLLHELEGMILVERKVDGKNRRGLMLALDLDQYDFNKGSQSLIRSTEGTILERLPPRIKIRQGAELEVPHILVLIDDPQHTVIEPLYAMRDQLKQLYDFELMLGSGHLRGYLVNRADMESQVMQALVKLGSADTFYPRYNVATDKSVLLFAVGDGNHSLATAKAIWETLKGRVGPEHPARYALVEIENVHDEGLTFEPIHRVLFNVKCDVSIALQDHFSASICLENCSSPDEMIAKVDFSKGKKQAFGILSTVGYQVAYISNPPFNLPVGTLQSFLDDWLKQDKAEKIDYVHGLDVVVKLSKQPGNIGFYLPAMPKDDLFKTVILDGTLPRKTFSMGEAHEKRFYMESRKITA